MWSQRPPSSTGRPMSRTGSAAAAAGRPPTAVRPPPTAVRVPTGVKPGPLNNRIKSLHWLMKGRGLFSRSSHQSKAFCFPTRSKINELTTETSRLHKEIEHYNQENSVYLSYEKRAEALAAEIKDLQGQLADYNMLVDKLNTNTEVEEMIKDYNTVNLTASVPCRREEVIEAIEEEIRRERQVADEVIQAMPSAKREKYFSMTTANEELLQELAVLQEELDLLATRKEDYEEDLSHSRIKQEMVRLHQTLSALEAKRDAMEAEQESLGSPQEEREKLLKQVKEDSQEIASMDRQLTDIRDRSKQVKEEIQNLEQDSEAAQGNWSANRSFLESFEELRAEELEKLTQSQENIVSLLEHYSRVRVKSIWKLQQESKRLQQDLEKIQQLEGKITGELSTLKEQLSTMESELLTYRDLDTLKQTAEDKKKRLLDERETLTQRRDTFGQLLGEMNQRHEALKTKLQENETHTQLTNLERKWQHLEQNNFLMKECILQNISILSTMTFSRTSGNI
uniref:Intraflagellar transport 74 n=1 Tax=Cyprinodon variegatus TaxID=28743 RepID=A0A3Q2DEE9_CYPVA